MQVETKACQLTLGRSSVLGECSLVRCPSLVSVVYFGSPELQIDRVRSHALGKVDPSVSSSRFYLAVKEIPFGGNQRQCFKTVWSSQGQDGANQGSQTSTQAPRDRI